MKKIFSESIKIAGKCKWDNNYIKYRNYNKLTF